jgi:hypothetical protein
MLTFLLSLFGRCAHERTTFPQTPTRRCGPRAETYVACLDCGAEFAYDWRAMQAQRAGQREQMMPREAEATAE